MEKSYFSFKYSISLTFELQIGLYRKPVHILPMYFQHYYITKKFVIMSIV